MHGLRWGLAAGLLCVVAAPAAAAELHRIDIPAGSLQQAVLALGRQAGISIALTDTGLAAVQVRRVRGRMSVDQALRRLLKGTPARHVALGSSSWRIVRAPSRPERPNPTITASAGEPEEQPEIVVTASKRNLLLRDYPGPAVVVGGEAFAAGSATEGTAAISERIPSLGSTHLGPGRDKLFIRAIADSSFSGQTQSTVGQYLGEARLNYNAPDPDLRLYDLASVELLPGPQGTLYGAGSMGGVLRLVPNAPDAGDATVSVMASAATTAHGDWSRELAAVANVPLVKDRVAVRFTGYDISDGGYIDDVGRDEKDVNRTRIRGGRAATLAELSDDWSLEAGGLIQDIEGRDSQYADRSLPRLSRRTLLPQPFSNDYRLGYATLRGRIGPVELTSTFSATDQDLVEHFDAFNQTEAPELFRQRNRLSLLSNETRLSQGGSDGAGWVAGVHVLHNSARLDRASGPPEDLMPQLGVRNLIDEQTIFGQATQRLSQVVSLTGGLRLTHVSFSGAARGTEGRIAPLLQSEAKGDSWKLLPAIAVEIDPGGDLGIYLRYEESFRPSGFIVRADQTQALDSDHIAAWEAGLRFGQRRSATVGGGLSLSYARWSDIQADLIDTVGLPTTANIGDGNIWTIDGRLHWLATPELSLNLSAVLNRSRVTNPEPGIIMVEESPLPNVPDVTARFGIDYARSLGEGTELQLSGWVRYVGESILGIGPILGRKQGDYVDTGFEARLGWGPAVLFLRATNLLDILGNRFALGSVFTIVGEDQITPLRPRTFRLGLRADF